MRPQSCKAKGRRHQQRLARDILAAFPHLGPDDVVSTSMGAGGEDLRLSAAARQALPLSIEAKNQERLAIWSCLQQCEANAPAGAVPCLVFTKNHAKTYAVVPWPVLLGLYRRLGSAGAALPPRLRRLLRELAAFAPEGEEGEAEEGEAEAEEGAGDGAGDGGPSP
jgi:hypothetical protein